MVLWVSFSNWNSPTSQTIHRAPGALNGTELGLELLDLDDLMPWEIMEEDRHRKNHGKMLCVTM